MSTAQPDQPDQGVQENLQTSYSKPPASWHEATIPEIYCMPDRKYLVSQGMIEQMFAGYNSIYSVFFGAFAGVAGVLWGFWNECTIEPTKRYYLTFAMLSTVLGVMCLIIFIIGYGRAYLEKRSLYKNARRVLILKRI